MLRLLLKIALFTAGFISSSRAELINRVVTFSVAPGTTTEVGLFRPLPSSDGFTANRSYTGSFTANIVFDRDDLTPYNFTFSSGAIIGSSYELQLLTNVIYGAPYGSRSTFFFQQAGQIVYSPTTLIPPGFVDFDGSLLTEQQKVIASQGIIVTGRSVTGSQLNRITDDYLNFPSTLPLLGSAKITITQVSKTQFSQTLTAKLVITADEEETILLPVPTAPALNTSILRTEVGTINSNSFSFTAPTEYGQWAIDNSLVNPSPESTNKAGIPYGILFALDLPKTTSSLPISISQTPNGPIATITLPNSGLINPMSVEYTNDLNDPDWGPLPAANYLNGINSLSLGAAGSPTFSFPAGEKGFIRFVTTID